MSADTSRPDAVLCRLQTCAAQVGWGGAGWGGEGSWEEANAVVEGDCSFVAGGRRRTKFLPSFALDTASRKIFPCSPGMLPPLPPPSLLAAFPWSVLWARQIHTRALSRRVRGLGTQIETRRLWLRAPRPTPTLH